MRPSPSLIYNNLTATPAGLAYAHKRQVRRLRAPLAPHRPGAPAHQQQPWPTPAHRAGHQRAVSARRGRRQHGDQAGRRLRQARARARGSPAWLQSRAAPGHPQRAPARRPQVDTQETGTVHTVRCCKAGAASLLVIAGEGGVQVRPPPAWPRPPAAAPRQLRRTAPPHPRLRPPQIWDGSGSALLYHWRLPSGQHPESSGTASYARGVCSNIAADGSVQICVGFSTGEPLQGGKGEGEGEGQGRRRPATRAAAQAAGRGRGRRAARRAALTSGWPLPAGRRRGRVRVPRRARAQHQARPGAAPPQGAHHGAQLGAPVQAGQLGGGPRLQDGGSPGRPGCPPLPTRLSAC
jgi:hypothetical protein